MSLTLKSNLNRSKIRKQKLQEIEQKVIEEKLKSQQAIEYHLERERELILNIPFILEDKNKIYKEAISLTFICYIYILKTIKENRKYFLFNLNKNRNLLIQ